MMCLPLFQAKSSSDRLLISISGIPGSGKTTLASLVCTRLNQLYHSYSQSLHPNTPDSPPISPDICVSLPLDGYHLTRSELSSLPHPEEAHYRRGAPFTFNGNGFLSLVESLRSPILPETRTIRAPSFSHSIKDPIENDIPIPPSARIVIIEGLYLTLDLKPWNSAASLFDESWFISVPIETASERLIKRHVKAGIAPDEAYARKRVGESDMRNAREILDHLHPNISETIESTEDDNWKPKTHDQAEALEEEKTDHHLLPPPRSENTTSTDHTNQNNEIKNQSPSTRPGPPSRNPTTTLTTGSIDSLRELAENGGGC
ncbi:putative kinase-related protein [Phaeomoniella chlamydospora]|uniref:Putative kinase-related protein n=1 Tax=Phaeomoniella chlamydospora TaxID=158046 RepID=A0A0G2EP71_PHACM|nr:putative kinase-related protein [Phaeomoniella chlamydospora]